MPTKKMTFALFCLTKIDIRLLNLTFEQCSVMIGECKNGNVEKVREELIKLGGIPKGNVVMKDKVDHQELYNKADAAGMEAVSNLNVVPMVVTEHADVLDDNSAIKKSYFVSDGPCGFAWTVIKPANSSFAKWLVKNQIASKRIYEPGVMIWCHQFNQSIQKKETYMSAFARVLNDNGIKAYSGSRMD